MLSGAGDLIISAHFGQRGRQSAEHIWLVAQRSIGPPRPRRRPPLLSPARLLHASHYDDDDATRNELRNRIGIEFRERRGVFFFLPLLLSTARRARGAHPAFEFLANGDVRTQDDSRAELVCSGDEQRAPYAYCAMLAAFVWHAFAGRPSSTRAAANFSRRASYCFWASRRRRLCQPHRGVHLL